MGHHPHVVLSPTASIPLSSDEQRNQTFSFVNPSHPNNRKERRHKKAFKQVALKHKTKIIRNVVNTMQNSGNKEREFKPLFNNTHKQQRNKSAAEREFEKYSKSFKNIHTFLNQK